MNFELNINQKIYQISALKWEISISQTKLIKETKWNVKLQITK